MRAVEEVKISVIVPVYKTEPYLRKCLDSILGQTYRNLEIILVDDGSPDNCGAICDEYAAGDARIRVIHQENGGVAAARNAGLDLATGDYIGWVDSDDWIEPEMFEVMLSTAMSRDADIVICGRQEHYPDKSFQMGWQQEEVLDKEQAMALLIEDDLVRSYLWDKLWRRELFDGVRVPCLKVFEDMAIMYQLFKKAEGIVCLPDVFYHYEHNEASLTMAPSLKSRMDFYQVSRERYGSLAQDFPLLAERLTPVLVEAAVHIWAAYYDTPKEERAIYDVQIKDIAAFCREHYKAALEKNQMGLAGRLVLRLTPYAKSWAFALCHGVSKLYQLRHGASL